MSKILFINEVDAIEYLFDTKNIFPTNMDEYNYLLDEFIPVKSTRKGVFYYEVKNGRQ